MRLTLFIALVFLPLTGCMTAAQEARQNEQIKQLVSTLTPEQKSELSKEILEQMTGLNQPPDPPYQPLPYVAPVRQQETHTYCYPSGGYVYCNSY